MRFSERLLQEMEQKHMKAPELYRKAHRDRRLFSKIRKNPDYQPRKETALCFALALELPLEDFLSFLALAGYTLGAAPTDRIIRSCVEEGIYDIDLVNDRLYKEQQSLLGY